MRTRLAGTVASVAFCSLMLELVISRLSVFYLNYANAYLAIPLTLFGLALGSMWVHLRKGATESLDLRRHALLLFCSVLGSLVTVFVLFSRTFPIVHHYGQALYGLLMTKTAVFVVAFLPPFFFAGTLLTTLFSRYRAQIGTLYAADLAAAGMASALTPLLFSTFDLPVLVGVLALSAVVAVMLTAPDRGASVPVGLAFIAVAGSVWAAQLDAQYDLSHLGRRGEVVREVDHQWNQFSRVSLLAFEIPGRDTPFYRLIHDNAESNVNVMPYDGGRYRPGQFREATGLPLRLGRKFESALVMFAGCGAQMIQIDGLTDGKARVTGVEINPLAKQIPARSLPEFRFPEFYAKDNVDFVVTEGRHFLNRDERTYDFIYAASDAPTSQYKTGHSRKYLDTYEAMDAYLDHLEPGGVLVFQAQPLAHKVPALRYLLADRGADPEQSMVIFANDRRYHGEEHLHLFISPAGFSAEDVRIMVEGYPRQQLLYAPHRKGHPEFEKLMRDPLPPRGALVTDDSPYVHKVDFSEYAFAPELSRLMHPRYYRSWIRVTTVLVLLGLVLVAFAVLFFSRREKPPFPVFGFLLVTGFAYMLCQVSLIGKLELFLGSPLLSMALLLSMFLLSNGLGSSLVERIGARVPIARLLAGTAAVAFLTGVLVDLAAQHLIGAPLFVRIVLSALLVAPLGVCLGCFYPFAVGYLTARERDGAVPITFAISTLSSVLGASFAMLIVINTGYGSLLLQATALYAALGAVLGGTRALS